jgi:hypothetical protein
MKTKLLAIVVMAACAFSHKVVAQDVAVVTLQHGETMTAYYGSDAFKEAVEAAEAGDLLTLSGGTFAATAITKPLKIQGAGYIQDTQNFRYRTTITGDMRIDIPGAAAGLLIEGLWFYNYVYVLGEGVNDYIFRKCRLNSLYLNADNSGGFIDQCRIAYELGLGKSTSHFFMANSIIRCLTGNGGSTSNTIDHCVVTAQVKNDVVANFRNSLIRNPSGSTACTYQDNVMDVNTYYSSFSSTNEDQNTIFLYHSGYSVEYIVHDEYKALFANGEARYYNDDYDYRLTDEAAAMYLGGDGTQVGIYGSEIPFNDVPTNPQVTFKNISPRSNANGKLSVRVTVEAQQ